jgi:hypothetical protein
MREMETLRSKITLTAEEVAGDYEQEDPIKKANKIREYKELYANYELEADIEKFNELVKHYPGSNIGPTPEDDPHTFMEYLETTAPKSMIKLMKLN